jgi:hypothetical protein
MMDRIWMIAVACALAGCGDNSGAPVCGDLVCGSAETAASCAQDCGCGNGVANLGEDCDRTDVGDATCESVAQRGGTLGCNADCTFDVVGCDEYMCGNGIAEPGEACDGADVLNASCATSGFGGGDIACSTDCELDLAACCNNFCTTANTSVCAGDTVEACTMQPNGCLGIEITNCAAGDDVCDDSAGNATCICVDRCSTEGSGRCDGAIAQTCVTEPDGCKNWSTNADCAMVGETCAVGPQGSQCTATNSAESCADAFPLETGQNVIPWSATTADHLTTQPTCNSSALTGPDLVLSYTATVDGIVTYAVGKAASQRHVVAVSNAACGTITAPTEVSCTSEFAMTALADTFAVTTGATYYFYVRDTTNGTGTLPSPLVVDVAEASCATLANTPSDLSPANGAVLATTQPILSFNLPHPVQTNVGVISITGDLGTVRTYDLAMAPAQVSFTNGARTVEIDPSVAFLPGETITVSWTGLVDEFCGAAIPQPTWTFEILTPSCTPGMNGMVGTTTTRRATGVASFTEYQVHADANPTGWVYFGGLSELYRMPKAGGPVQNVVLDAGITSTPLGYSMASVSGKIFTLDSTTSATSPFLTRLSSSDGLTWNPLAYGRYPTTAGASAYSMFHRSGTFYIAGNETSAGVATQLWSITASAVQLPAAALLLGTVAEEDCDAIAGDDTYFYMACDNSNDRIVRVNRTTLQSELLTDQIPLNTTKNELHADDLDADGKADVLYVKSDDETVRYICGPAATGPFWHDILVSFGSSSTTTNYGLGFDQVGKVLWAYDDDTQELVIIQ